MDYVIAFAQPLIVSLMLSHSTSLFKKETFRPIPASKAV